jgi:phage gp45-like
MISMVSNLQGLAARLDRLEQRLERLAGGVTEFTTLARVNATGADDQANFAGNPSDRQRPVRRVSPSGLSGRPVAGVLGAIIKAAGGAFNGLVVGISTDRYGPQNLKEGETCLWNKGVAQVLLDQSDAVTIKSGGSKIVVNKDGDVTIDASGTIKLAGGGPGIARKRDSVQVSIPALPVSTGSTTATTANGTISHGHCVVRARPSPGPPSREPS